MSPTGHNVTAAALGFAVSVPLLMNGKSLEAALCFAGAMQGARAPDWIEISKWVNGKRYSLIPHRGVTHWPGSWIAGAFASVFIIPEPWSLAFVMFFASALLHLLYDVMTPSGIPILHPFARNTSLFVYRASSFGPEVAWSLYSWCLAILIAALAYAYKPLF